MKTIRECLATLGLLLAVGLMTGCSEKAQEPQLPTAGSETTADSRIGSDGREVVEGVYKFDDGFVVMQQNYNNNAWQPDVTFVPLKNGDGSVCTELPADDIRVVGTYFYDIPNFGKTENPWIKIDMESSLLPVTIDWLKVEPAEKDGAVGLTLTASPYPEVWEHNERAIKIDIEIGLNDRQCTKCSLKVAQLVMLDDSSAPIKGSDIFDISAQSPLIIPAAGGSGSFTMSYKHNDMYSYLVEKGFDVPFDIPCHLGISRKFGNGEDTGSAATDFENQWVAYSLEKITTGNGEYDLGWAQIKITNAADGSKEISYTISENRSGKTRQLSLGITSGFSGPEYALCRPQYVWAWHEIHLEQHR